jgi:nucleoside-specific outer membrane channel protein Tsx
MRWRLISGALLWICAAQGSANAQETDHSFFLWSQNSISVLPYGSGFTVDSSEQAALTFEHSHASLIGDMYLFIDYYEYLNDGGGNNWYGEIGPRLSLGKVSGEDFSIGSCSFGVTDVLIATQYERGSDADEAEAALIGAGFDLALPNFSFAQLNVYARSDLSGATPAGFDDVQVSMSAAYPFEIGKSRFLADGYFDWILGINNQVPSFHFNPQIKLDLGNYWGNPDAIFVGLELDFWWNKYQIESTDAFQTDQQAASLMVQMRF